MYIKNPHSECRSNYQQPLNVDSDTIQRWTASSVGEPDPVGSETLKPDPDLEIIIPDPRF
jgi:hypothetical protein